MREVWTSSHAESVAHEVDFGVEGICSYSAEQRIDWPTASGRASHLVGSSVREGPHAFDHVTSTRTT